VWGSGSRPVSAGRAPCCAVPAQPTCPTLSSVCLAACVRLRRRAAGAATTRPGRSTVATATCWWTREGWCSRRAEQTRGRSPATVRGASRPSPAQCGSRLSFGTSGSVSALSNDRAPPVCSALVLERRKHRLLLGAPHGPCPSRRPRAPRATSVVPISTRNRVGGDRHSTQRASTRIDELATSNGATVRGLSLCPPVRAFYGRFERTAPSQQRDSRVDRCAVVNGARRSVTTCHVAPREAFGSRPRYQ
jgi:hypothetical protein